MSSALGTIYPVQMLFVCLQGLVEAGSLYIRRQTQNKFGMTPESSAVNLTALAALVFALINVTREQTEKSTKLYGGLCAVLMLQSTVSIFLHLQEYFKYKSLLRRAKLKYERTGEKTPLHLGEYRSLNTLMLAVVVRVYAVFALGAGVYFAFIGFPEGNSENEINLNWK